MKCFHCGDTIEPRITVLAYEGTGILKSYHTDCMRREYPSIATVTADLAFRPSLLIDLSGETTDPSIELETLFSSAQGEING